MRTLNAAALVAAAALAAGCATAAKTTAAAQAAPPAAPAPAAAPAPLAPEEAAEARALALALERIHFALDSAALSPTARAALDEAAGHLARLPGVHLTIEGHADARGDAAWNHDLAEWRAAAVIEHLAARGVDRARLALVSHGEARPIAAGADERAHALNRRVEFHLLRGDVELILRDGQLLDDAGRPLSFASASAR